MQKKMMKPGDITFAKIRTRIYHTVCAAIGNQPLKLKSPSACSCSKNERIQFVLNAFVDAHVMVNEQIFNKQRVEQDVCPLEWGNCAQMAFHVQLGDRLGLGCDAICHE